MSLTIRLGQLHLHEVKSVLANIRGHFLNGNGTLADCIEGLWIVVVFKISGVVISLGPTVILRPDYVRLSNFD